MRWFVRPSAADAAMPFDVGAAVVARHGEFLYKAKVLEVQHAPAATSCRISGDVATRLIELQQREIETLRGLVEEQQKTKSS